MLTDFQAMQDGHQGSVNVNKHMIQFPEDISERVNLAFYHAGPRTREFGKVENQQGACLKHKYKFVSTDGKRSTDRPCTQESRHTALLHLLSKTTR